MPDIALRFHLDMLAMSSSVDAVLAAQGVDLEFGLEYLALVEPETIGDALRLCHAAGAPCLTLPTHLLTPSRLMRTGARPDDAPRIARALCRLGAQLRPQHLVAVMGPCGLPLDESSKASLNEHRDQYARAARLFADCALDAILLDGFTRLADAKSALMGCAQAIDVPVMAVVRIDIAQGLEQACRQAADVVARLEDCGAQVAGFSVAAAPGELAALARAARAACSIPLMAQVEVASVPSARRSRVAACDSQGPVSTPDQMVTAAAHLHAAGAQFIRAAGQATPAFAGAAAATLAGLDVRRG
ncbi:methionine synthase [Eggerthellaceae bacterium zg-1084]|uniref:homocysteine S-methyltransferase family protein n=1 Tax=Berryella wangjianweii TaxID=2734634 RepID=UPI00155189F8|nr:homocysteine S-methyltransferase family protein [Berryella wangjianweii]NPD30648.1 methionine synthase [Berryella wangjianweii]